MWVAFQRFDLIIYISIDYNKLDFIRIHEVYLHNALTHTELINWNRSNITPTWHQYYFTEIQRGVHDRLSKNVGSGCLSVWVRNSTAIASIHMDLFTEEVISPWVGPPLRRSGSGSKSGLNVVLKDSSPLLDRTQYSIKVRHDIKRAL